MTKDDWLKLAEHALDGVAIAAEMAEAIPAVAVEAKVIDKVAQLGAAALRAIEAKDGAQLAAVAAQLDAAIAGLPAELAADDAQIDAVLK